MTSIPAELANRIGGDDPKACARWAETFEVHGGLTAESSVLDIGCGPGRMALAVGERYGYSNPEYVGFDIVKADIDWLTSAVTAEHPNFRFVHLDIKNMHYNQGGTIEPWNVRFPVPDRSIDFIFATSIFTHMRTREMLGYLAEARRCLAPGGKFLATYFCIDDELRGNLPAERNFRALRLDEHCYTAKPNNPEDAIGYDTGFVIDCFKRLGFKATFYRGAWSTLVARTGRHNQDYVVAAL